MEDSHDIETDALRAYMPTSFGKQSRAFNTEAQFDLAKRAAYNRAKDAAKSQADGDSDADSDDEDSDDDEDEYPVSHELILKTHERAVTTATLDPAGVRLVTGSTDCTLKFHDFSSMTPTTIRAFKSVDPTMTKGSANVETHPVHQAVFNPISPSSILVVTALPQAKIISREGEVLTTFVKGDMYIRDMHNTKGHISEVTTGVWHPTNRDLCVTAGTDSTLRIWDINNPRSQKDIIVHKSKVAGSGGKTRMTAVAWGSPLQGGNNILVAAALDGSLAMWGGDGPYLRPASEIKEAHVPDTWTGSLDISPDGRLVVTRGGDDTIKLWDTRKFKEAISTASHTSTSSQYPTTNIRFSPNSNSIVTGSQTGDIHFLNPATLKADLISPITPGSALISVLWHEKLNQIITTSANAETRILFNPERSNGGAKAVISRAPKRRHIDDDPNLTMDLAHGLSGDSVVNPSGTLSTNQTSYSARHPTVGLTASGRSRDPRRPHIPMTTPFAKSGPDEKNIKELIPLSSMRDEDPREALLKYQEKAEKDPMFTNAWKHTQPKTIYAELSEEEDDEEPEKKRSKR